MNRKLKKQYQKRAAAAFRKRCFNQIRYFVWLAMEGKVMESLETADDVPGH